MGNDSRLAYCIIRKQCFFNLIKIFYVCKKSIPKYLASCYAHMLELMVIFFPHHYFEWFLDFNIIQNGRPDFLKLLKEL